MLHATVTTPWPVGEVQVWAASGRLTQDRMDTLFDGYHTDLNAATNRDEIVDTFTINANLALTAGRAIRLVDTSTGTDKLLEIDNGAVVIKDA